MGNGFSLEHASIVGWLTRRDFPPPLSGPWPGPFWEEYYYHRRRYLEKDEPASEPVEAWKAPRVTRQLLQDFLEALPDSVVTRHQSYLESLRRMAKTAHERLLSTYTESELTLPLRPRMSWTQRNQVLSSGEVAQILAPLRRWFDVPFYFLLVGSQLPLERYRDSPDYTLWLQCEDAHPEAGVRDLLDPFPPLRAAFGAARPAPATLCW